MAFDKKTRNELGKMVAECRRHLTTDVRAQLQSVYGIQPNGTSSDVSKLKLDDRGREIAVALRQWLEHLAVAEAGTEKEKHANAFERIENETAFTYLNRLAALRMCEERELIIECVRNGLTSAGFQLFERLADTSLGDRGNTYRVFLECLFDELAIDLGVLFDRRAVHSLIFPSSACIANVLEQINKVEFKELWSNDETIGWVYQFFNSDDERKKMRKKSAAPRNSRELAVRNQFFTPRYVVEFLTDNTLGRTWYEMCRGSTQLTDQLHYFVKHDKEVFLPKGQIPTALASDQQDLSKEELLEQEVEIAYRAKKDPRDLKILDPASGSGHFLLYAFDLLETIYEEAWADNQLPDSETCNRSLRNEYKTIEELRRAVPKLILTHNLFGIDIDHRACQIAALALWLRAQRRFKELGLRPADPFRRINKTNIVCAEPMPGNKQLLEEFIAPMNPPILRQLTQAIFDAMNLAAEAGSLLKIEDQIRGPLAEARKKWETQAERAKDKKGRDLLFSVGEMEEIDPHPQQMLDLSGITDDEFWIEAEPRILAELRRYAASASHGKSVQRSLFAGDAEQGFAFVDLCRQRYDVVLMNPPFGDASLPSKSYIDDHYGDTKGDVYKAFVEAFEQRLVPCGLLGIISNRSGFFKRDSSDWRDQVALRLYRPLTLADLGYFVLDAKVDTAAYVFQSLSRQEREQLTLSLTKDVRAVVADAGSPFSVAKYRDHRGLKRHQAEQELEWLSEKGFVRMFPGNYPRFESVSSKLDSAESATTPRYRPLISFRLLSEQIKEEALQECVRNLNDHRSYVSQPAKFGDLPNRSFAYWLDRSYRNTFSRFGSFIGGPRTVKQGPATAKDFRFIRTWWEVDFRSVAPPHVHPKEYPGAYCVVGDYQWFPHSKGGRYSPYYGEIPCVINWFRDGSELKAWAGTLYNNSHWSRIIKNVDYVFRPGLTYLSRTTVRTCAMPLPAGAIFGVTGPGIFVPIPELEQALARFCSYVVDGFLSVSHGQGVEPQSHRKQYEVGIMQLIPWPESDDSELSAMTKQAHRLINAIRASEETSRFFTGAPCDTNAMLEEAIDLLWNIDVRVAREYDVELEGILIKGSTPEQKKLSSLADMRKALKLAGGFPDPKTTAHNRLSYAVGCVMGRWDIRYANQSKTPDDLPGPFEPLPACSPGMLVDDEGRPANITPNDYPIEIQWDGILVEDAGIDGNYPKANDIVKRVRDVLVAIHGDAAESTEQEIYKTLKLDDLRNYFRSAGPFFERHQKAYRKGGRDAPIYWPISSEFGSYTLWIYYPRLSEQTLYTAVNKYVVTKIEEVARRVVQIGEAIGDLSGKQAVELQDERARCLKLQSELETFRDQLLQIAGLPYKPDLNDGVMICASPLWELIPYKTWSQRLKACWQSLSEGEFEWAHLAYSIWPERVRAAAESDISIAIAHGLATIVEVPDDAVHEVSDDDEAVEDDDEGEDDE
jgi:hypothetical protein